ncbi:MAG: serine/threonine protein kinase [Polyangiaceae bacterium]|nr:serine/threonine protein kinase [Polyangiaceae bacterium]
MDGADDELLNGARARVGRVLKDKWHLDKLLGIGGMAAVYEATHRNRSRVAVKMLHPSLSLDRDVRQRFLREGYVANSVEHDGVVRVLDDDVDEDGTAFLVLDLLEGETLDARWARAGGRLPLDEVASLMADILDVLAAAHGKGVVHRDVKPENIFLTTRGEVKLLDFGIARLRETSASDQAALTRSGATMGTPVFMAPEQARGRWEQVDERTDVWAVGAMMFTLLSGHWVHEAETWNETLILAAIRPARSLGEVLPEAPPVLASVVDRALAFEKGDRWESADAMRVALQALSPAELVPLKVEYLRTQPAPSQGQFVPVGGLEPADPLSATDPGVGWPSVSGTRPPVSRRGRGPTNSSPDRGSLSSPSLARGPLSSSPARSQVESSAAFAAFAPNPTVVPATMRASQADAGPATPRPRSRFPTWLVLLTVTGGGVYYFRSELVPHLDAWSARGGVSSAGTASLTTTRPEGEGTAPRPEGDAPIAAAQPPKGATLSDPPASPTPPTPPEAATAPEAAAPTAPPTPPAEPEGAVPPVDASASGTPSAPLPVLFPPPPSASGPAAKPPAAAPPQKPPAQGNSSKKNPPPKPPTRSKTSPKSPGKGHKR